MCLHCTYLRITSLRITPDNVFWVASIAVMLAFVLYVLI